MAENTEQESENDKITVSAPIERDGKLNKKLETSSQSKSEVIREALKEYHLRGKLDPDALINTTLEDVEDIDISTPRESVEDWKHQLEEVTEEQKRVEGEIQDQERKIKDLEKDVAIGKATETDLVDAENELDKLQELKVELGERRERLNQFIENAEQERERREKTRSELELLALEDTCVETIAKELGPVLEDFEDLLNAFQKTVEEMNQRRRQLGKRQKRFSLFYKLLADRLVSNTPLDIETPGYRNNTGGHEPQNETPLEMLNPPDAPDQSRVEVALQDLDQEGEEENEMVRNG